MMARKVKGKSNKLKKTCPQCKAQMQSGVTVTKGDLVTERQVCTRCGQTDVIGTLDGKE